MLTSSTSWRLHRNVPLKHLYPPPQYFVDQQGEELIVFIGDSADDKFIAYRLSDDVYFAVIAQFYSQISRKLKHYKPQSQHQSLVIDTDNGLLYSYDGRCAHHGIGTLLTMDLNHNNEIVAERLIDSRQGSEFESFSFGFRMCLIHHHIHFISGHSTPDHWTYDIKMDTFHRMHSVIDNDKMENRNGGVIFSERYGTIFIFGGCSNGTLYFDDIYALRIGADHLKDDKLVIGFIRNTQRIERMFVPNDQRQLILKYYSIPNDTEWRKLNEKMPCTLSNFGCVLLDNQEDVLIFGGCTRSRFGAHLQVLSVEEQMSNTIYKYNIAENAFHEIKQKCPIHGQFHAVYCTVSQTIHLFEDIPLHQTWSQVNSRHWSFQVSKLGLN